MQIFKSSTLKIAVPALLFGAADQLAKFAAATFLRTPNLQANPLQLAPGISLNYQQNIGIAWSIFIPQPWLSILNIALLIVLPLYISKHIDLRRSDARFFLAMIVGGALGNLFDRLTRGFVIDYIAVGSFPVFNLADSLLTIGIFLILVFYGKIKRTSRT